MKLPLLIGISMTLNLALAGGLLSRLNHPAAPRALALSAAARPIAGSPTSLPPITPGADMPFDWNRLLSDDLAVYRDNLRAAGCPSRTIRHILRGEINERFRWRRDAVLAAAQNRFWDLAIGGELAVRNEWGRSIESLAAERQKLIDDVLGEGSLETDRRPAAPEAAGVSGAATPQSNSDALRSSKNSLWASGLSGFQPTEAEWRAITKLEDDYDSARMSGSADGQPDSEALQARLEQGIRDVLGPERYAEYQLANNGDFQNAYRVIRRYDLPESVAVDIYRTRQNAEAGAEAIRNSADLSADARQAALAAIQQQASQSLAAALEAKAFATYQEYDGSWLQALTVAGEK